VLTGWCSCADIPLSKAVAGVRVGHIEGRGFVVAPTEQEMEQSSLDLMLAGTADAVLMIEGYCDFLSEEQMLEVGTALGWSAKLSA
jgi:polyribonucleotide nucleotidyltransferase